MRRIAISVAASTMTLSLAGCGALGGSEGGDGTGPAKGNRITVGLLLPEKEDARYERFDYPAVKKKVAALTREQGRVVYANAEADAKKQAGQLEGMIGDGVDVILLDAVDAHAVAGGVARAKEAGIPVIAYDRLAEGPVDAYVSFDKELIGEVQGRSLLEALGDRAGGSTRIVMMNGSPADPDAGQFKKGALSALTDKVYVAKSYDIKNGKPGRARANMAEAIDAIGADGIAAVYSADDGMAGGVIEALKNAGVADLPPVTGQGAELSAVRRIVAGDQYMSVYKPYPQEAESAAEMAVAKVQGRDIQFDALTRERVDSPTHKDIPARLVPVVALTRENIGDTVVADGIHEVSDICTAEYASACAAIGLDP